MLPVQPFWNKPATVHHSLDTDIVKSMHRGNEKCSSLMMMDPSFDSTQNLYHIEWTDEDVSVLLEGMFMRSLEILRFSKPDNPLFKEELEWQSTAQFAEIAAYLGYDPKVIRQEVSKIMRQYGKRADVQLLMEFEEAIKCFAVDFKQRVGVKVVKSSLYSILLKHCEHDFDLLTQLKLVGEMIDDLYLDGYDRFELLAKLAETINTP